MKTRFEICALSRVGGLLAALFFSLYGPCSPLRADQSTLAAPEATKVVSDLRREALRFRNGDLLYGALESISSEKSVRWRHEDVAGPIDFLRDRIAEIDFRSRPQSLGHPSGNCRIRLSNNDELVGNILVLGPERIVLQTWYAGEITLARSRVLSLQPTPREGTVVFEGPTGLEGWTIGKVVSALGDAGEWRYRNGAFYATNAASIARKLNLPDAARIEFDLAWKGIFQLAIAIYTDYMQPISLANKDTEPDFGGFYSLQLNSFSANLLPVKKNDPLRYLGQINVPAFNQKNSAHVEIRASKARKSVSLLVDGQLLKEWQETEDFAGQGTGVRFVHQGQGKVKLSHLKVAEWDGQTEDNFTPNPRSQQDLTRLRNGDKLNGEVESIQDGKLMVNTPAGKLGIPLSRVKGVEFAGLKLERGERQPAEVHAYFTEGGGLTFQLQKWESGEVVASSPNFGTLTFDATTFSRLDFPPFAAAKP